MLAATAAIATANATVPAFAAAASQQLASVLPELLFSYLVYAFFTLPQLLFDRVLADNYDHLRRNVFSENDRLFYVTNLFVWNTIPFFALSLLFLYVEERGWLNKYKIEPKLKQDVALTAKAAKEEFSGHFFIGPLFLYFVMYDWDVLRRNPSKVSGPFPDVWTFLFHLFLCAAIEDTMFYWSHRALHHPSIYSYIHKKHHEFVTTNGFAAGYAHPIETVFGHVVPSLVGLLLLKSHFITHCAYTFVLVLDSFVGHCGYDLPLIPFTSSLRHCYHHSHNVGTYGLKFGFWDRLCGTDRGLNKHVEAKKRKAKKE